MKLNMRGTEEEIRMLEVRGIKKYSEVLTLILLK